MSIDEMINWLNELTLVNEDFKLVVERLEELKSFKAAMEDDGK